MAVWCRALLVCSLSLPLLPLPLLAQDTPPTDGILAALRNAVALHPSIKSRLNELNALDLELQSEKARRLPSLSLQAQALTDDQSQVFARVQQPLWVGGRIDGAIKQAGMRLRSGRASLLALQRQLMEDTAAAYAVLIGFSRRLAAIDRNVAEHEKLLGLISRRQAGSIASEADVRLARARLTMAIAQREQTKGELQRALADLLALTQEPAGPLLPIPDRLLVLPDFAGIATGIVEASATVQQRRADVEVVRTEVELRRADLMPSLYARLDQNIYGRDGKRDLPVTTKAGVVLEGSLEGAGLAGWKRIKSVEARIDAARKDVETARTDARRRAETLLAVTASLQSVMESNELLVAATEETLASFMRQYDAGRKTWVDVLNAQRELSDARLALEQTRSSLQENTLRLSVQIGRLDSMVIGP
ncbi:TolC family protein [Geotalea sp. SG265]|uniref:TolC family protein n=1 Tax=Geotalea sp. SG265 TaxID=2922867 RepID=UPI001FAF4D1D|nr:TolC family protein [Geotalea sp. SG265]